MSKKIKGTEEAIEPRPAKTRVPKIMIQETPRTIHTQMLGFQKLGLSIPRNGKGNIDGREYNYATLDDVIKICQPKLNELGIYFNQLIEGGVIYTHLVHAESGAEMKSSLSLGAPNSPQEMGTRITYFRRYCLISALGLSTEEDVDADPRKVLGVVVPLTGAAAKRVEETSKTISQNIEKQTVAEQKATESVPPVRPMVPATPVPLPLKTHGKPEDLDILVADLKDMSVPMVKATSAIDSCKNPEALDLIVKQVDQSVKLTVDEKLILSGLIQEKYKKINGTK